MGNVCSGGGGRVRTDRFERIPDKYHNLHEVSTALRQAGLEASELIVGVDFTKSNTWTGQMSFSGKCLHEIESGVLNPYQEVIATIGETLSEFDDDQNIPVYGFGDKSAAHKCVFSFLPDDEPCKGFAEVLRAYSYITPKTQLSGPTTFGPLIRRAIDIVVESGNGFHVLLIICDGQITRPEGLDNRTLSVYEQDTINAIIEASNYPLSIVVVGVGDGPWDVMYDFDDKIPSRKFDNFQFVPFNQVMARPTASDADAYFSMCALMEVPEQYRILQAQGVVHASPKRLSRNPQKVIDPPGGKRVPPAKSKSKSKKASKKSSKKGSKKNKKKKKKEPTPPPSYTESVSESEASESESESYESY